MKPLTLDQAAEWVNDARDLIKENKCYGIDEIGVDAMTDAELIKTLDMYYKGGMDQFIIDNK